ncbi:hypothetical protein GTY86_34350, partial [Streptomyces sp. SID5770]|nr:hypothetical protein [Streptomyces sp. SID5770]
MTTQEPTDDQGTTTEPGPASAQKPPTEPGTTVEPDSAADQDPENAPAPAPRRRGRP